MRLKRCWFIVIVFILIVSIIFLSGCGANTNAMKPDEKRTEMANASVSPDEFLKKYGLDVENGQEKFSVTIPSTWDVIEGDYPVGLYWQLANVFSSEAGLDLTPFKGAAVKVLRYQLSNELHGEGRQSDSTYQSKAVLLTYNNKVIGSWLALTGVLVGPSVKKNYLKDITGLTFEKWIDKENVFKTNKTDKDLSKLDPINVLKQFFKAINDGNKKRAYACIDPDELLIDLTVNMGSGCLYNKDFSEGNSFVENLIYAKPTKFEMYDPSHMVKIIKATNLIRVEVLVLLSSKWKSDFGEVETDENDGRFVLMRKYKNGWKLGVLGTGA